MSDNSNNLIAYQRSRFSTHLPAGRLYTPSHAWLERLDSDCWRVGVTKFATRMLGDMVDHAFEPEPETPVACGQIVGWLEGFKAISDIYCVVDGHFLGGNPALKQTVTLVNKKPYSEGWLYEARGEADDRCIDVHAYMAFLDKAIDKILEKEQDSSIQ
jgi:glycine cleavage system H protein